jgi:hypothetical protein
LSAARGQGAESTDDETKRARAEGSQTQVQMQLI